MRVFVDRRRQSVVDKNRASRLPPNRAASSTRSKALNQNQFCFNRISKRAPQQTLRS